MLPAKQNIVDTWLSGRSPTTITAYRFDLEIFAKWLNAPTIDHAAQMLFANSHGDANQLVHQYRSHLIANYAPNTINRRLAAIRSLVQIARMMGVINYALDVQNVKSETVRDTRGPKIEVIADGIAECNGSPTGLRDRAILRLLFDLALRRSEVTQLDRSDYDGEVLHVQGKGNRSKTILEVPGKSQAALNNWLMIHPGTDPLFVALHAEHHGNRLSHNAIRSITLRRVGCSPHKIRHTSITKAIQKADNLADVQSFSRHSAIETVLIYYDQDKKMQGKIARKVSEEI